MQNEKTNISDRLLDFAAEIIKLSSRLNKTPVVQLVLKELKESLYWLRLIEKADLLSRSNFEMLLQEANELTRIIAKSVVTAKKNG